ncbi:DedA family protein [Clostridium polynesiense]|uniref:DedA family protein n=1 Tax=Clostridium polynesiense TaxID=1325933 RepID=UPI003100C1E5
MSRFPKQEKIINKNIEILRQKGSIGVFISRLIPVARTIISVPAGVLKLEFVKFTLSSAAGIFIWNGVFIGAGYFLGESFLYKFL